VFKKWWHERIIKRSNIKESQWQNAFASLPVLQRLDTESRERLKNLTILFLHYKSVEGVQGQEITENIKIIIGLQACLPILNLGLDWYEGWVSVIVYPGAFSREKIEVDECGVVHKGKTHLSGESWQRGPVILSWDDIFSHHELGRNVVIHEFAHKLDMLNGRANGFPPLHKGMSAQTWAHDFNQAYADLSQHLAVDEEEAIPINDYATTSPAEFFAVFSEYFFEAPIIIQHHYPKIFAQLVLFYRQDPLGM
jgi:Mlc titration factor MtfA (ptsG expression regulator)